MSDEAPTDALRLVNPHKDITENLRQAAVDLHPWFVGDAKTFSVDCALPAYLNDAADEIERLRAAAPASPLPGGGDMDWQDKAEGLESDLRQAVLVAWKRGAEEWCRLNYPQWVDWLEACHTPAARAFLASNGKGETK